MQEEKEILFKDTKIVTNLIKYLLYMYILSAFVSISFGINESIIWINVKDNLIFESEAHASINGYDVFYTYNFFISIFIFIFLFFLILYWTYNTNNNSKSLGAVNMKFSPFSSIAWYFIPIFNLWKPYQAMGEIYKTSVNPKDWEKVKVTQYLSSWWSAWLLSFFIGRDFERRYSEAQTAQEFLNATSILIVNGLVTLLSGLFLLVIINKIYKLQMHHYLNMNND